MFAKFATNKKFQAASFVFCLLCAICAILVTGMGLTVFMLRHSTLAQSRLKLYPPRPPIEEESLTLKQELQWLGFEDAQIEFLVLSRKYSNFTSLANALGDANIQIGQKQTILLTKTQSFEGSGEVTRLDDLVIGDRTVAKVFLLPGNTIGFVWQEKTATSGSKIFPGIDLTTKATIVEYP